MKWQEATAIYVIGHRYPIATFVHENHAIEWAESTYPGDWLQKKVKIPKMPITNKKSSNNLKNLAKSLENLDWSIDSDEEETNGEIIDHN